MPYIVKTVGTLITVTTSSTSSSSVGHLDDASNLTVYVTTSAAALTSGTSLQVAMWDFADSTSLAVNENFSTAFYLLNQTGSSGAVPVLTSGQAITVNNVGFKALRLNLLGSANTAGEIVAWVTKQITV